MTIFGLKMTISLAKNCNLLPTITIVGQKLHFLTKEIVIFDSKMVIFDPKMVILDSKMVTFDLKIDVLDQK